MVEKNVQAIILALGLLGFKSEGYKVRPSMEWHEQCIRQMGDDWMKFYKYKLSAWKSCALDQHPPPRPDGLPVEDNPSVLLGGRVMEWLKLMKRAKPKRFAEIIATLDTVKRAMERPGERELNQALEDTFVNLTTIRPTQTVNPNGKTDSGFTDSEICEELRRTVQEAFGEKKYTPEDSMESFFPSTKSNYLKTRSKGGAVGAVMSSEGLRVLKVQNGTLISFRVEGKTWRSRRLVMDDTNLSEKWRQLYEYMVDEALSEDKKVKLVALAEALKVRVISKGPVFTYTVLKPLQKWMWKILQRHPSGAFRLVGEEISAGYLEDQIGELREGEKYLSGDYKAATDNLNPLFSDTVVDELNKHIQDKRIQRLFKASLTGHLIENPKNPKEFKPQQWGQLMGSITSFPILCLVNATLCRLVRETDVGRKLTLDTAKISINGDDCVFRATEFGRDLWERLARHSGMAPSIGKYFFASEFLNMNSAQFSVEAAYCDLSEEGKRKPHVRFLHQTPQINMGLLVGQGRSTSGKLEKIEVSDWGTLNSISKNAHSLVNGCAEEDRERVFKAYQNANWDTLTGGKTPQERKKKGLTIPWFLPEHLGGLGLPTFPNYYVEKDGKLERPWMPTEKDLRLAAAFYKHGKLPSKSPDGISWKVWEYAQQRMRSVPKERTLNASELQAQRGDEGQDLVDEATLMGKFCVEALFTLPFGKVYDEKGTKKNTLGKLKREIARVMKHMGTVEPFNETTLPLAKPAYEQQAQLLRTSARVHAISSNTLPAFSEIGANARESTIDDKGAFWVPLTGSDGIAVCTLWC